ncbi:zinc metallochaperone AztD [Aquipuribacter hungaricus]|uniref:Zinc metallochaperone AztD n=1 Tax=Aquipuribacter hungaricus TaxID=545624 RepID=A0ABV7WFZ4_9MICO
MAAAAVLVPSLLLAACGSADSTEAGGAASGAPSPTGPADSPSAAASPDGGPWPEPEGEATEAAASSPRLAVTHADGIVVLDAMTLETVEDFELDGFTRVNAAGDGRHVMVTTTGGFAVLDTGTWARPHGDHDHYWTAAPRLSEVMYPAEEPGHVVAHGGRTVLFDDGTGQVVALDSADVADPAADRLEISTGEAHHGVAVELSDGSVLVTEGTEDARSTVRVLDAAGTEVARTDDCPGVHGEATAADEAVVVGCEDGVVVWAGGALTKVAAPDAYGRIGNQRGTHGSPFVLGDYTSDPDAELERPTRVSVIDTRSASLRLVDLPASYSFRSLGRGDAGEALVLGTDGALHVIDPETATLTRSVPVVAAWEEPEDWQEPRPTLLVHDGTAYVTEPATSELHAVDLATGEVWASVTLGVVPDEITAASGEAEAGSEALSDEEAGDEAHEDHEDAGHEDEPSDGPSAGDA